MSLSHERCLGNNSNCYQLFCLPLWPNELSFSDKLKWLWKQFVLRENQETQTFEYKDIISLTSFPLKINLFSDLYAFIVFFVVVAFHLLVSLNKTNKSIFIINQKKKNINKLTTKWAELYIEKCQSGIQISDC